MSRALNDLSPRMRPVAFEFLARLAEAGICVMVITTSRTQAEQQDAYNRGVSWTLNSKHLTGDAIDVCPYEVYTVAAGGDKLQWDASDPVWKKIGAIGQALGLKWGVVKANGQRIDPGHFEYVAPAPTGPRV